MQTESHRGREDRLLPRFPLPPNRTCGSPAYGSPVGGSPLSGLTSCISGCGKREQPELAKVGIRPPLMVFSTSASFPFVAFSKDTPQTHPYPSIYIGEGRPLTVFEVPKPPNECFVYFFDDLFHTVSIGTFRLSADRVSQFLHALLARPSRFSREMISEKIEAFHLHIDNLCLFRM